MAIGDEVSSSLNATLSFDELLSAFHELFDECSTLSKMYSSLKKKHAILNIEFEKLKHDNPSLPPCTRYEHLKALKKENLLLKKTLKKFKVGSKSLNMILANKGHIHRRGKIRFVSSSHQNPTTFVKCPTLHVSPHTKCNFCCKPRHVSYKYSFKRYSPHKLI